MDHRSWLWRIIATLLVGGLFRLFLLVGPLATMPQTEDGPSYRKQALEILDGTAGHFYFPPGTALSAVPFYALCGNSEHVDHAVASFLWILFAVSCSWLAWLVLEDKRAAWVAALLASFLPHTILATATISSQPLNAALVACVLSLCLLTYRSYSLKWWLLISIAAGLAVVTRPATGVLLILLIGYLLDLRKRNLVSWLQVWGSLGLLVVGVSSFVYPVMLHNSRCGQGMTISTNSEWNMLVGNNPYTPDYKTGHMGQRRFERLPEDVRAYLTEILPHGEPADATYADRIAMRDTAIAYIQDHPIRFLYRVLNRLRAFWGMDYTAARELQNTFQLSVAPTVALLVVEGGGFVIVLFLAVCALMFGSLSSWYRLGFYVVASCMMAPYLVAFTVPKYHTVVLPILFPLAAAFVVALRDGIIQNEGLKNRRNTLIIMMMVFVLLQVEHVFHIVDNR